MASKIAWSVLMIVSMRVVGVSRDLPDAVILAGVAVVFVITVLPISPGGAGVPELLYITIFTAYTGGADTSAITAGVMLFRAFQWAIRSRCLDPAVDLPARQATAADQGGVPGRSDGLPRVEPGHRVALRPGSPASSGLFRQMPTR